MRHRHRTCVAVSLSRDELVGVPVLKQLVLAQCPLTLFITDFSRVRRFYRPLSGRVKKTVAHAGWMLGGTSNWIDLSDLDVKKNDLSHFPFFFDPRDNRTNTLPMIFAVRGC